MMIMMMNMILMKGYNFLFILMNKMIMAIDLLFQKKYARVKDEMLQWDELHSQLLSQIGNAAFVVTELQMLKEEIIPGFEDILIVEKMEALEMIFNSMNVIMKEFHRIVMSFDKVAREADQLLRGSTPYLMQLHIDIQPCLQQRLDSLKSLHEMYKSEYILKSDIISTFTTKNLKCSADDLIALWKRLNDQPNIPKDKVQAIFDILFPKNS